MPISISFLPRFCWILLIALVIILIVLFCPSQINQQNKKSDRTVALLGPREIELVSTNLNHVLYVISLDGKITAIDVRQKGHQLWIADTGSPLVNSTLSKIEISRDSKSIRLIPSLIGGLYEKSDEDEYMQPLPFDAESLLNTSSQFHDELIMTGGKDIDTLGLDLNTGKVIYSFSKDNIDQTTLDNKCPASILIIKRIKQTVRARNVQNGYEKWIFSVSNHELFHLHAPSSSEVFEQIEHHPVFFEYQLQTGVVLAFDYNNHLVWTSSINNPIAAVWEFKNGQLKEKSLFKTRLSHRLAFMGEFNSTPYVIISPRIQRQLISHARKTKIAGSTNNKGPILSSWHKANQKRLLSMNSELSKNDHKNSLAIRQDESRDIVGYLELIDANKSIIDEGKNELSVHINSHSTWTMSTVCLGALIIICLWYSKRKPIEFQHQKSIISENSDYQLTELSFQSRYILEYEHVRFLGRGGFGVVFEAINKLDERCVAIKRVSLKKSSGKERALKEIRCLAVLNHPNLIQYYYAWNESPPDDWQDEEDKKLIIRNNEVTRDSLSIFPTSGVSDDYSKSAKLSSTSCLPSLIDFTFERSLNPPQEVYEHSNSSLFEHSYDSSDEEISNQSKSLIEKENSDCPTIYFYFVMELCQSESLRDCLIKKTIHQSQVWSIMDQIIKGIEYIHSQKLIHRDLKPSNILFSLDNTVKIGDFGLVSAFGEDKIEKIDHTGNNEVGGTILYMSPEQMNRQSYNQKVDIYAIGIILFELLYPFSTQMERTRTLTNVRLQTPIFPIDFESNQLNCRLIRWLLAYSPHDRPKACEFRQDNSYQNMVKNENLFC